MKFNHPFQLKQERNTTDILPAILPSFEKRQTSKDANAEIDSIFSVTETEQFYQPPHHNKTPSRLELENEYKDFVPPNPIVPKGTCLGHQKPIKATYRLNVGLNLEEKKPKRKKDFYSNTPELNGKQKKAFSIENDDIGGTKTPVRLMFKSNKTKLKKIDISQNTSKLEEEDTSKKPSPEIEFQIERKKLFFPSSDEIIEIAEKEENLTSILKMEFKKLQGANPIVYSRNGKAFYNSEEKGNYDISLKELHILIKSMENKVKMRKNCSKHTLTHLNKLSKHQHDINKSISNNKQIESQLTQINLINKMKLMNNNTMKVSQYYTPTNLSDLTLVFESRFESGNLDIAMKVNDEEYNLLLQNDLNTNGNIQWFYFKTSNTRKGELVKFNILNFAKAHSLYNKGMQVMVHSEKENNLTHSGWTPGGIFISYFENCYKKNTSDQKHRTLTFTYEYEHDFDVVSFAYSEPYTYSQCTNHIDSLQLSSYVRSSQFLKREVLTTTIAGHNCEVLTITSPNSNSKKYGIILTGRVHPGESVSSWMVKGVLDFLCSSDPQAITLRNHFVFKIVPLLNPDGVIQGNYRCSLTGGDLNRKYAIPSQAIHPTIFYLRKLTRQFAKQYQIAAYIDFHGHSRKKDVFAYGNTDGEKPELYRIYPFILSKICKFFSFKSSKFAIQKSKLSTARIAMWRELNISNVFTVEASFYGPSKVMQKEVESKKVPENGRSQYSSQDLEEIGKNICQAFLPLYKIPIPKTRNSEDNSTLDTLLTKKISDNYQMEKDEANLLNIGYDDLITELQNQPTCEEKDEISDGSDSNPSEDNIEPSELMKLIQNKAKQKYANSYFHQLPKKQNEMRSPRKEVVTEQRERNKDRMLNKTKSNVYAETALPRQRSKSPKIPSIMKNNAQRMLFYDYIELVDAWTQTSDGESDEIRKKRKSQDKEQSLIYSSYKNYELGRLNSYTPRTYSREKYKIKNQTPSQKKKHWEQCEGISRPIIERSSNQNGKSTIKTTLNLLKIMGNPNIQPRSTKFSPKPKVYQGNYIQKSYHLTKDETTNVFQLYGGKSKDTHNHSMISQRSNNAFSEKREEFRTPEATPISGFRNFIKHSPVVEKNKMTMKACAISKTALETMIKKSLKPNRNKKSRLEQIIHSTITNKNIKPSKEYTHSIKSHEKQRKHISMRNGKAGISQTAKNSHSSLHRDLGDRKGNSIDHTLGERERNKLSVDREYSELQEYLLGDDKTEIPQYYKGHKQTHRMNINLYPSSCSEQEYVFMPQNGKSSKSGNKSANLSGLGVGGRKNTGESLHSKEIGEKSFLRQQQLLLQQQNCFKAQLLNSLNKANAFRPNSNTNKTYNNKTPIFTFNQNKFQVF